ncbi:hypothetical protein KBI23_11925 [bacterium]|nr:hypothetical protein [bacterium]MBP9808630.1 hypothetical protein [bacterium]
MAWHSLGNRIISLWLYPACALVIVQASFQGVRCEGERCGSTQLTSAEVEVLERASAVIERESGDSNQPSRQWLIFQKILKFGNVGRDSILLLLQKGTPAGRIYGAILLKEIDPAEAAKVLKRLSSQSGKVSYVRGCAVESTTVGDLAKRILNGEKLVASDPKLSEDILDLVAKHPLGVQVKGQDGLYRPARFGDPLLARAVEHLKFIERPWTVSVITDRYLTSKGRNDQISADLLRVLAASRDRQTAKVLGPALYDGSLSIRVAATYGIMDYLMDRPVSGGTEEHMEAAKKWWQKQQQQSQP